MGIRVNIESIAGGFAALPLSRVDIYATIRRGDDKSSFSKLLLQNVLVLAADQTTNVDSEKRAMPATTVTVALTPEEILKVNLVKEFGPLSLALRKFNDNQKKELSRLTMEDLLGEGKEKTTEIAENLIKQPVEKVEKPNPIKEPVVAQTPKTRTHVVWEFNGEKQRQIEFTLDEDGQVLSSRVISEQNYGPSAPAAIGPTPPAPKQNVNPPY
jgi:Flp pilus assembly protein CpaB